MESINAPAAQEPVTEEEPILVEKDARFPIECYCNRELSWLAFNKRVLDEANAPENPLCEQLNFLSIYESNLDEFFMVRVGTLYDQRKTPIRDNKTCLTAKEQLELILPEVRRLNKQKDKLYKQLTKQVREFHVDLDRYQDLPEKDQKALERFFTNDILPLLSPQIIAAKQPFPFLNNKEIYCVVLLRTAGKAERLGIVNCSSPITQRLIAVPGRAGHYILLEDLVHSLVAKVFIHYRVLSTALIRVIRNADISIDDFDSDTEGRKKDYRKAMENMIRTRTRLSPIRLDFSDITGGDIINLVCRYLDLPRKHAFFSASPLDLSFLGGISDQLTGHSELFYPKRIPQASPAVSEDKPIISQLEKKDVLLTYPYENIRPFLKLLYEAAEDPEVVSIKITLYRLARNSQVVDALTRAAENGKEVLALVELRARFDEENNVEHSKDLEAAGCRVIYGLDNIKIHSKLCVITRVHNGSVEYITQVGTGNYNEKTARLYTDLCLMTANQRIGAEAAKVFQALALGETVHETSTLLVSPECLQSPVAEKLDREIFNASQGKRAFADFKLNSLTDKLLIDKLIEASRAGVRIRLLIRGICCLVPGVPGYTENITVHSIVGRYLEHSRIYIFCNDDSPEVYISSADLMTRNTTRRVEVAVPIFDADNRTRLINIFETMLRDTVKRRVMLDDGTYIHAKADSAQLNVQEYFMAESYRAAGQTTAVLPPVREEPKPQQEDNAAAAQNTLEAAAKAPSNSSDQPAAVQESVSFEASAPICSSAPMAGCEPAGTKKEAPIAAVDPVVTSECHEPAPITEDVPLTEEAAPAAKQETSPSSDQSTDPVKKAETAESSTSENAAQPDPSLKKGMKAKVRKLLEKMIAKL